MDSHSRWEEPFRTNPATFSQNYRIWAAMNNVPLDDSPVDGEDGEDEMMEVDGDDGDDAAAAVEDGDEGMPDFFGGSTAGGDEPEKTKSKRKKTKVAALVRQKIEKALDSTGLADKRARQCDETDFLKLLHALNSEGIHFA